MHFLWFSMSLFPGGQFILASSLHDFFNFSLQLKNLFKSNWLSKLWSYKEAIGQGEQLWYLHTNSSSGDWEQEEEDQYKDSRILYIILSAESHSL